MIDFQNVSFAYEKGDPVIDGISFTIPSGESVGLIGANGAGKSTVMKLLLGLLQGEGTIRVGGTPVIKENLAKMSKNLPVFLIAGAKDPVGSMGREVAKVKAMFEAAGMKNVSMKLYEDDRHEILNEADHETVYHDIVSWIGRQL